MNATTLLTGKRFFLRVSNSLETDLRKQTKAVYNDSDGSSVPKTTPRLPMKEIDDRLGLPLRQPHENETQKKENSRDIIGRIGILDYINYTDTPVTNKK